MLRGRAIGFNSLVFLFQTFPTVDSCGLRVRLNGEGQLIVPPFLLDRPHGRLLYYSKSKDSVGISMSSTRISLQCVALFVHEASIAGHHYLVACPLCIDAYR